MKHETGYHYAESGLPNVWLMNGFSFTETPYGRAITIEDMDGLHLAIGLRLCEQPEKFTGPEVRFLRHELDLSQKTLAGILGVKELTVARWESGKSDISAPAQRLLSMYYREKMTGDVRIAEALEKLSALDVAIHAMIHMARTTDETWAVCA